MAKFVIFTDENDDVGMTLEKHTQNYIGCKIVKAFDAKSSNEASQQYYDYCGFGQYRPFGDGDIFYDDDGNVLKEQVK